MEGSANSMLIGRYKQSGREDDVKVDSRLGSKLYPMKSKPIAIQTRKFKPSHSRPLNHS